VVSLAVLKVQLASNDSCYYYWKMMKPSYTQTVGLMREKYSASDISPFRNRLTTTFSLLLNEVHNIMSNYLCLAETRLVYLGFFCHVNLGFGENLDICR